MESDINYLDLLILKKLEPDSTVEKFGPLINTSFFETANILGTMKIKGLIDIQASVGGLSPIIILPKAKDLISLAIQKASEPLDSLDFEILSLLKKGIKELVLLEKTLNITSLDLALRLYKLKSNGYISDQVQSARVYLSLTEKGFLVSKEKIKLEGTQTTLLTKEEIQKISEQKKEELSDEIDEEIKELIADQNFLSTQKKQPPDSSSATSAQNLPKQKRKLPWEVEQKPIKLDRTTMLLSKIEYYIQHYGFYILLSSILVFLVIVALILIFIK
ncbi:MAG: hypothetical protein QXF48_00850 [Candidatus Anstonellaceae archaeon]